MKKTSHKARRDAQAKTSKKPVALSKPAKVTIHTLPTGAGITILSTVEVEDSFTSLQFSHYVISFLTDDIIRMRYVEKGVVVIHPRRTDYVGMVTGIAQRSGPRKAQEQEAAPEPEAIKYR